MRGHSEATEHTENHSLLKIGSVPVVASEQAPQRAGSETAEHREILSFERATPCPSWPLSGPAQRAVPEIRQIRAHEVEIARSGEASPLARSVLLALICPLRHT